jgi:type IV secretory pathway ATPase VirB11/archaellum biosynthesis ATPase
VVAVGDRGPGDQVLVGGPLLEGAVVSGLDILLAGGTQAGKTTLLNCLCAAALARERVITCEEVFELAVSLSHMAEVSSPGGSWAQVATCRSARPCPHPTVQSNIYR